MIVACEIEVLQKNGTGIKRYYSEVLRRLPMLRPDWKFIYLAPDTAHPGRRRKIRRQVTQALPPARNLTVKFGAVPGPLQRFARSRFYKSWKMARLLAKRVDVFYTTQLPGYYNERFRTAIRLADIIPVLYPKIVAPETARWFAQHLQEWVERAHLIFAPTECVKMDIVNYCRISPEKVVLSPDAVDQEQFMPRKTEEARSMLSGVSLPERFILYAGRLDPWKNIPTLVAAFARLVHERRVPHELVLAGLWQRGLGEIQERMAKEKVQDRVHLLGYVTEKDLPLLYNLADCFVFPSWYEGFGIPILEAMASGCPVVTSTAPALHEVAGGAALEVDPVDVEGLAEAIYMVLMEPRLRARLVERGLRRARQFSWEETSRNVAESLEMLKRR